VVPRHDAPAPTLATLTRYLVDKHGLETVKLPELLRVFTELPLNPAGKIDKAALRALLRHDTAA
jgi:acyl-CoA synthetase